MSADAARASRWIVLVGYMGAGKSTVGPLAAAALGVPYLDSDEAIEEAAGMAIPEIFAKRGEVWFRRTEERVIRDLLSGDPGVLALGGGAVESGKTRDLLPRAARVAWLRVDAGESWRRVAGTDRPLAQDRGRFMRRAARREALYEEVAERIVDASRPPSEVADEIVRELGEGAEAGS